MMCTSSFCGYNVDQLINVEEDIFANGTHLPSIVYASFNANKLSKADNIHFNLCLTKFAADFP